MGQTRLLKALSCKVLSPLRLHSFYRQPAPRLTLWWTFPYGSCVPVSACCFLSSCHALLGRPWCCIIARPMKRPKLKELPQTEPISRSTSLTSVEVYLLYQWLNKLGFFPLLFILHRNAAIHTSLVFTSGLSQLKQLWYLQVYFSQRMGIKFCSSILSALLLW